jgi:hypothetical protein
MLVAMVMVSALGDPIPQASGLLSEPYFQAPKHPWGFRARGLK